MQDLAQQIEIEMKSIERQMETEKRAIKRAIGDPLVMETAESNLKALHTRMSVLQRNLEKCGTPDTIPKLGL